MAVSLFEDREHASAYLQYRVTPHEMVYTIMNYVRERMPQPLDLAVDVGCGSGQGTVLLAPYFNKVMGTDVSPAQLENAQANRHPPNVIYRQSPAEDLPFQRGSVDLVTAMTAAHWFDRLRFLKEADRILKPGGCLALLSYPIEMDLEYGDLSTTLTDMCQEFYTAIAPFRHPHIRKKPVEIYLEMFHSCPYPDKEWHDCLPVRRTFSVNGFIEMLKTFSTFQQMQLKDPDQAEYISSSLKRKLLSTMQVSSPETKITVTVKYFCWLACKP